LCFFVFAEYKEQAALIQHKNIQNSQDNNYLLMFKAAQKTHKNNSKIVAKIAV